MEGFWLQFKLTAGLRARYPWANSTGTVNSKGHHLAKCVVCEEATQLLGIDPPQPFVPKPHTLKRHQNGDTKGAAKRRRQSNEKAAAAAAATAEKLARRQQTATRPAKAPDVVVLDGELDMELAAQVRGVEPCRRGGRHQTAGGCGCCLVSSSQPLVDS